jgi:hypothetical protein
MQGMSFGVKVSYSLSEFLLQAVCLVFWSRSSHKHVYCVNEGRLGCSDVVLATCFGHLETCSKCCWSTSFLSGHTAWWQWQQAERTGMGGGGRGRSQHSCVFLFFSPQRKKSKREQINVSPQAVCWYSNISFHLSEQLSVTWNESHQVRF